MLGKAYRLLAFVSLACVLAGGGLVAFLFASGRLNADRVEQVASILRGEARQPPASQPASAPASAPAAAVTSAEELRRQRRDQAMQRALLERTNRDLAAQKELLDQATAELIAQTEQLERRKRDWLAEQDRRRDALRDEGFERELKFVSKLPAKLGKDHLIKTWNKSKPDAVRLLSSLTPSAAQRLLEQMKTIEEQQILHELLEQLRNQDAAPSVAGTGKAPDAAP